MKRLLKNLVRAAKFFILGLLAVAVILLVAVSFFEQKVPAWALERISERLSSPQFLVRLDAASFRLTRGLRLEGLRVFDREKVQVTPFISAGRVDLKLALERIPWSMERLIREVVVTELSFPRLPDGYYIPDSIEFPGQPDFREVNAPLDVEFPRLSSFRLVLVRPDILSVRPKRVTVESVVSYPKLLRLHGILIQWPDLDVPMALDGDMTCDMHVQNIRGSVHGQARQRNIRPMLGTLDITNCFQFIDSFTGVVTPVDATCQFDVNLMNNDLHIFLDLHPTGGSYRGVPFKDAHGLVDVSVFVRDTYQNAKIVVGPVAANFPGGRTMEGTVIYENTNDIGYVTFDVRSTTSLSNALAVADVLTDGTLDCLQPETPPEITLKGMMAVNPAYAATNDLKGTIGFLRGKFFSVPLKNARSDFHVKGTEVKFFDARANSPGGGDLSGGGFVSFPDFNWDKSRFGIKVAGQKISLEDVSNVFGMDAGARHGKLACEVELTGPLGDDIVPRLKGKGHTLLTEGNLASLNLLSGLFNAMEKVPGLGQFVNQTRAATGITISESSMSFTLADGVLRSDDVEFRGGFLTITAKGTYDLVKDNMDFAVRVKIVKDDSLMGMLKNPILWPFSKLSTVLFGFRASGSLKNPSWNYDTAILERFR